MRLDPARLVARVEAIPGRLRPVKMSLRGLKFSMDVDEAIDLARHLVAAVDELKGTAS